MKILVSCMDGWVPNRPYAYGFLLLVRHDIIPLKDRTHVQYSCVYLKSQNPSILDLLDVHMYGCYVIIN